MNIRDTDRDVLMLAGMVNGSLNHVDRMMEERSGIAGPTNKLNLQAILRGESNSSNSVIVDPLVAKAYVSEEYVKAAVPDTSVYSKIDGIEPHPVRPNLIPSPQQPAHLHTLPTPVYTEESKVDPSKIELELASIKNLLERINGNLTKMSGMLGKVFCSFNEKTKNLE